VAAIDMTVGTDTAVNEEIIEENEIPC